LLARFLSRKQKDQCHETKCGQKSLVQKMHLFGEGVLINGMPMKTI